MESTEIEPDPRLTKMCLYCSRLVSKLHSPLRQLEQGEICVNVENPPDFRTWVVAAENGCGMCSAFLDALLSAHGREVISTASPKFKKVVSGKVKWIRSGLTFKHPNYFSRNPEDQNKIIALDRLISPDDEIFFSQTSITERESSKHQR
jgi:hypothetical protein